MWYVMIHFDGGYVNGFLSSEETKEKAIKQIKYDLIGKLKMLEGKLDESSRSNYITERDIKRVKSFLRAFKRPWRTTNKHGWESPVIKAVRIEHSVEAGYWLENIKTGRHICNEHRK